MLSGIYSHSDVVLVKYADSRDSHRHGFYRRRFGVTFLSTRGERGVPAVCLQWACDTS